MTKKSIFGPWESFYMNWSQPKTPSIHATPMKLSRTSMEWKSPSLNKLGGSMISY
jgi:hypothetical protein